MTSWTRPHVRTKNSFKTLRSIKNTLAFVRDRDLQVVTTKAHMHALFDGGQQLSAYMTRAEMVRWFNDYWPDRIK